MDQGRVHVVFGAGQVGSYVTEALLGDGEKVRVVKRGPGGIPKGAEGVFGDAVDAAFCRTAVADACAIYHCMNPAYGHAAQTDPDHHRRGMGWFVETVTDEPDWSARIG
jgi:nucleoside-diphosphate-sugar epimerase